MYLENPQDLQLLHHWWYLYCMLVSWPRDEGVRYFFHFVIVYCSWTNFFVCLFESLKKLIQFVLQIIVDFPYISLVFSLSFSKIACSIKLFFQYKKRPFFKSFFWKIVRSLKNDRFIKIFRKIWSLSFTIFSSDFKNYRFLYFSKLSPSISFLTTP